MSMASGESQMIIVHGTIPLQKEQRDRALELARKMSKATRREPGCISYDFYVGLNDPDTLMLFQEWENIEALMQHFQTPHMEEFLRELPSIVSGEITTRRYAVQSVQPTQEFPAGKPPVLH